MTAKHRLLLAALLAASTAGCSTSASTVPAASDRTRGKHPTPEPVYVLPNCQSLAGKPHCNWIEPAPTDGPSREQQAPAGMAI